MKYYALRAANMACTISNVERLHKCYASIHTASRNRLALDRVDRIAIARRIRRSQQLEPVAKNDFDASQLEKFESLSAEQEAAIVQWADMMKGALRLVQQTIQDPNGTASSDETASSEGEDSDDDAILFDEEQESEESNVASDVPDESVPVMPAKLVETGRNLGLYGQYMQ